MGIRRPTATSPSHATTDSPATRSKSGKARLRLRCGVRTPVVRRYDLDVLDLSSSIGPLVLDPKIGELYALVHDGQVVREGPVLDLFSRAIWPAIRIGPVAVSLL